MKKICCFIVSIILIFIFNVSSYAKEEFTDGLLNEYSSQIFNSLSDDTKNLLEEFDINNNFDSLFNMSPGDIINFLLGSVSKKIVSPLKNLSITVAVLTIISVFFTYIEDEKSRKIINMIFSMNLFFIMSKSIISIIGASCSSLNMITKLTQVLLPILAGLIASCRNPLLALTMESTVIYFSNILTFFTNKILSFFAVSYFVLSVSSCTFTSIDITKLCSFLKNAVIKILGIVSSFFVSFLSLKGLLVQNIDTLSIKGTKLLISNVIPIIGSNISEAYSTVSYSLSLLKSSIGIIGIISILSVSLPMIAEIFLYNISFFICENVALILNLDYQSKLFEAICSLLKILNLILIFSSIVLIISVGIMIKMRSNV